MNILTIRKSAFSAVAVIALFAISNVEAALDMFLEFPGSGIVGESDISGFESQIEVLTWHWGLSQSGASDAKKKINPLEPVCVDTISVTKFVDTSTAPLIVAGVMGTSFGNAKLTVVRPTGDGLKNVLILEMFGISVVGYMTEASGGDDRLSDTVELHFESIIGTYYKAGPTGASVPQPPFTINSKNCT